MLKLITLTSLLALAACSDPPPCPDAACLQARMMMLQAVMGNLQQSWAYQQANLANTQNSLALIAAGTHLETPRYEPVPFPNTMIPVLKMGE